MLKFNPRGQSITTPITINNAQQDNNDVCQSVSSVLGQFISDLKPRQTEIDEIDEDLLHLTPVCQIPHQEKALSRVQLQHLIDKMKNTDDLTEHDIQTEEYQSNFWRKVEQRCIVPDIEEQKFLVMKIWNVLEPDLKLIFSECLHNELMDYANDATPFYDKFDPEIQSFEELM
jgi:hypothetical protein